MSPEFGKRLFSLHIQSKNFDYMSPYKDTFKHRIEVYDPFQSRQRVDLRDVIGFLPESSGYETI